MNTELMEQIRQEDDIVTYFADEYERIWRFCVGPYTDVKPDKQRFMYLARLRDEIQEAKNKIIRQSARFALEELDKATQRDYPIFDIKNTKGMGEFLKRFLSMPEYAKRNDEVHEVNGTAIIYMENEPIFDSFMQRNHFFHYGQRDGVVGGVQLKNLLIYYKPQKTSPYWTVFNNQLRLHSSEFWIFGLDRGIMKNQPYTEEALKFIIRRVKD